MDAGDKGGKLLKGYDCARQGGRHLTSCEGRDRAASDGGTQSLAVQRHLCPGRDDAETEVIGRNERDGAPVDLTRCLGA